jgi:hypothetical protein
MDQLIGDLPRTLIGWTTLVTLIVVAAAFIFYTWRNQSLRLLREQIDDLIKRVEVVEAENKRLCDENKVLQTNFLAIKSEKNYLENLVIEALTRKKELNSQLLEKVNINLGKKPR